MFKLQLLSLTTLLLLSVGCGNVHEQPKTIGIEASTLGSVYVSGWISGFNAASSNVKLESIQKGDIIESKAYIDTKNIDAIRLADSFRYSKIYSEMFNN